MRLIDADKLIELIDDDIASIYNTIPQITHDISFCTLQMVKQYIKALPTVDAVPVVRCKDCKRYTPFRNIQDEEMDEGECEGYDPCVPANHFCSRGERRENVNSDTDTDDI